MVKMKGDLITFTGKDAKMVRDAAKKAKMSPKKWLMAAIETHAKNVLFIEALTRWDEKPKIQGVQIRKEPVRLRREGTD